MDQHSASRFEPLDGLDRKIARRLNAHADPAERHGPAPAQHQRNLFWARGNLPRQVPRLGGEGGLAHASALYVHFQERQAAEGPSFTQVELDPMGPLRYPEPFAQHGAAGMTMRLVHPTPRQARRVPLGACGALPRPLGQRQGPAAQHGNRGAPSHGSRRHALGDGARGEEGPAPQGQVSGSGRCVPSGRREKKRRPPEQRQGQAVGARLFEHVTR